MKEKYEKLFDDIKKTTTINELIEEYTSVKNELFKYQEHLKISQSDLDIEKLKQNELLTIKNRLFHRKNMKEQDKIIKFNIIFIEKKY